MLMKKEVFSPLYVCSFKEQIASDVERTRQAGMDNDQVAQWLQDTYGEDIDRLSPEGMKDLQDSLHNEGWKYLFRKRNRMSLPEFRKEMGDI